MIFLFFFIEKLPFYVFQIYVRENGHKGEKIFSKNNFFRRKDNQHFWQKNVEMSVNQARNGHF